MTPTDTDGDEHTRDFDPEDAYDVGDPLAARLELVARMIHALAGDGDDDRRRRRRAGVRDVIARLELELEDAIDALHALTAELERVQ